MRSDYPFKADIKAGVSGPPVCATSRHMQRSKEPLYSMTLVSAGEQHGRHDKTERLGGFEIDREFILGRRLHRKVAGLLAFKYAIDVTSNAPELVTYRENRLAISRYRLSSPFAFGSSES
jgi:hypothetical protein